MSNLNILIVEDESLLALEFSSYLKDLQYNVVDCVTNSKDAVQAMQNSDVNLIVMDVNLGEDIDGIDLYTQLNTNTLVIYLTAYMDDKTIAKAIETEPLGYLTKPINDSEFRAILKLAEVKIAKNATPHYVKLSNTYSFDMKENQLYNKGSFVKLSSKKLQLLRLLIEAKGELVSFKSIEDALYGDSPPGESALRTLIYRLRNELEHDMIENELNVGIKLKIEDSSPDTCGT